MLGSHLSMLLLVLFMLPQQVYAEANFEDTRCRCVCPNTRYFSSDNQTSSEDNHRRYYTMTNINPSICNPVQVVKHEVTGVIDDAHMDAFLANCDCRHESRNTVMLKVVVIFVMCLIALLVVYMSFLMCLDPMLRKKPFSQSPFAYRSQNDEIETNIFAGGENQSTGNGTADSSEDASPSSSSATIMRTRTTSNVLGRVEAEQNRWMKKVEEQRKNIFTDHTMLN